MQLTGSGPESEAMKNRTLSRREEENENPKYAAARTPAFDERRNAVT
jgi:hypothetical protein